MHVLVSPGWEEKKSSKREGQKERGKHILRKEKKVSDGGGKETGGALPFLFSFWGTRRCFRDLCQPMGGREESRGEGEEGLWSLNN